MKKRILYLLLPVITLILEILPYGAVCNFANHEGDPWRRTYSYFTLTPFGYANFSPFLTAILTCLIVVFVLVFCITGSARTANTVKFILCAAVLLSLGSLAYGIAYYTFVAGLITLSLGAELLFLQFTIKKPVE